MKHEKKIHPQYFQKILEGKKNFELRLADWKCKEGDELVLREWDTKTKKYTGRKISKTVTYVIKTKEIDFWPQKDIDKYGYQIISFK